MSLPTSISKLNCLKGLNLTGCIKFEDFPEILEPMEHMQFLILEGTMVKELPLSIGNLIRLKTLNCHLCCRLKKLPSLWVGFRYLEVLNLSCSSILKIPDEFVCSTLLRDLDLSRTMIQTIPASIKQASQLSRLCLINCKFLLSLPELPVLRCLRAAGCTSLKTVSSSSTALTQGWNKYELFQGKLNFFNCPAWDRDAQSNIMADAKVRIMWVATASSKFREENSNVCLPLSLSHTHAHTLVLLNWISRFVCSQKIKVGAAAIFSRVINNMMFINVWQEKSYPPLVTIVCPAYGIPSWFRYHNKGSSIKLPPDWIRPDFLGSALCACCCCLQQLSAFELESKVQFQY